MKNRIVATITNNEDYVRMRIFDGDLKVDDAAAELIRIAEAQARSAEAREAEWRTRALDAETKLAAR